MWLWYIALELLNGPTKQLTYSTSTSTYTMAISISRATLLSGTASTEYIDDTINPINTKKGSNILQNRKTFNGNDINEATYISSRFHCSSTTYQISARGQENTQLQVSQDTL